jgi:hypothetical protein
MILISTPTLDRSYPYIEYPDLTLPQAKTLDLFGHPVHLGYLSMPNLENLRVYAPEMSEYEEPCPLRFQDIPQYVRSLVIEDASIFLSSEAQTLYNLISIALTRISIVGEGQVSTPQLKEIILDGIESHQWKWPDHYFGRNHLAPFLIKGLLRTSALQLLWLRSISLDYRFDDFTYDLIINAKMKELRVSQCEIGERLLSWLSRVDEENDEIFPNMTKIQILDCTCLDSDYDIAQFYQQCSFNRPSLHVDVRL